MTQPKITAPLQYIDLLRSLAIISVVLIHVSSPIINMTWARNMEYWWVGNCVNAAVRYAVPLFLMISGATLLAKEYSLSHFYAKRFSRVFLPFLFWLPVYWVFRWCMLSPAQTPYDGHAVLQWAVNLFLTEGVSKHFWYIYMLLFLYMVIPFVGIWLRKLNFKWFTFTVVMWFLLTIFCQSVPFNAYNWTGEFGAKFFGYFLYMGYLVLGFYATQFGVLSARKQIFIFLGYLCTVLTAAVGTYYNSTIAHRLDLSLYGNLTPNSILQSLVVFLLIKNVVIKNKVVLYILNTLSNYSYGIYLVHILILGVLFRAHIFWTMAHPLLSVPLMLFITLFLSFLVIFVIRKIPFGKYIAG